MIIWECDNYVYVYHSLGPTCSFDEWWTLAALRTVCIHFTTCTLRVCCATSFITHTNLAFSGWKSVFYKDRDSRYCHGWNLQLCQRERKTGEKRGLFLLFNCISIFKGALKNIYRLWIEPKSFRNKKFKISEVWAFNFPQGVWIFWSSRFEEVSSFSKRLAKNCINFNLRPPALWLLARRGACIARVGARH